MEIHSEIHFKIHSEIHLERNSLTLVDLHAVDFVVDFLVDFLVDFFIHIFVDSRRHTNILKHDTLMLKKNHQKFA